MSTSELEAAFRGSVMRAYVETMRLDGVLDRVIARLDPETRALAEMPPTSSEFVPARHSNSIIEAHHAELGADATRSLALRANRGGVVRITEPLIRTALRLGGGGPGSILSRLDLILKRQQRGYELGWAANGERSGRVHIVSHGLHETAASLVSWEGALANAFELAGTAGTIRTESRRHEGSASRSVLLAVWGDPT